MSEVGDIAAVQIPVILVPVQLARLLLLLLPTFITAYVGVIVFLVVSSDKPHGIARWNKNFGT